MSYRGTRQIRTAPTRSAGACEEIDVIGDEARPRAEAWIEAANLVPHFAPEGHIRAVNEAGQDYREGIDFFRLVVFLDRLRCIRGIVQEHASTDESVRGRAEGFDDAGQIVGGDVAVVIGEGNEWRARGLDTGVACARQPRL